MSDPDKSAAQTIDDMMAERDAKAAETKAALAVALAAHIDAATEAANLSGWHKGFNQGWVAASEHFKNTMGKELEEARAAAQSSNRLQAIPAPSGRQNAAPKAAELVSKYIERNPGMRGFQIAKYFERAITPLPERTVRTALHRLKNKEIKIVDGRWYALSAAPADPQPSLIGDDDAAT